LCGQVILVVEPGGYFEGGRSIHCTVPFPIKQLVSRRWQINSFYSTFFDQAVSWLLAISLHMVLFNLDCYFLRLPHYMVKSLFNTTNSNEAKLFKCQMQTPASLVIQPCPQKVEHVLSIDELVIGVILASTWICQECMAAASGKDWIHNGKPLKALRAGSAGQILESVDSSGNWKPSDDRS
jgi:hypothetical protein